MPLGLGFVPPKQATRRGWPKGKPRGKGIPKSPKHRAAIAASLRGKPKSKAHVEKMRSSLIGRKQSAEQIAAVKEGIRKARRANPGLLSRNVKGPANPRWIRDRTAFAERKRWLQRVHDAVRMYVTGTRNPERCQRRLGYTPAELRTHLQSLFEPGMTWSNYGRRPDCWCIDHRKPVCTFDTDTPVAVVNALSNLRPIWSVYNQRRPHDGSDV